MPKRTNEFQHFVALIEASLHLESATVRESKQLVDKITGARREVDVVVAVDRAVHPLVLDIKCKGGLTSPRPATVEWVEQMWAKHMSLPTGKLILMEEGGFTRNAQKRMSGLGPNV